MLFINSTHLLTICGAKSNASRSLGTLWHSPIDFWWTRVCLISSSSTNFLNTKSVTGDASDSVTSIYIYMALAWVVQQRLISQRWCLRCVLLPGPLLLNSLQTQCNSQKGVHLSQDIHSIYDDYVRQSKTVNVEIIGGAPLHILRIVTVLHILLCCGWLDASLCILAKGSDSKK